MARTSSSVDRTTYMKTATLPLLAVSAGQWPHGRNGVRRHRARTHPVQRIHHLDGRSALVCARGRVAISRRSSVRVTGLVTSAFQDEQTTERCSRCTLRMPTPLLRRQSKTSNEVAETSADVVQRPQRSVMEPTTQRERELDAATQTTAAPRAPHAREPRPSARDATSRASPPDSRRGGTESPSTRCRG